MKSVKPTFVLGIGNTLTRDEEIGLDVVREAVMQTVLGILDSEN